MATIVNLANGGQSLRGALYSYCGTVEEILAEIIGTREGTTLALLEEVSEHRHMPVCDRPLWLVRASI